MTADTSTTDNRCLLHDAMRAFFLAEIQPGSTVLDVGCGDGRLALLIARRIPGTVIKCIDGDRARIKRARRRFRMSSATLRLSCRRGYADELHRLFDRSRFDCAIINNAFHEFWNPVRSLRAVRSVLRTNGLLLVAELTPRAGEAVDDCPRYSNGKVRELVERSGFRIASLRTRRGSVLIRAVLS